MSRLNGHALVTVGDVEYPYVYRWDRQGRKGQPCRVVARGMMNSCLLEFPDGFRMVTSRNALKRWSPAVHEQKPAWRSLQEHEVARGFQVVQIGSVPWLPAADWGRHDCVSLDGNEVRLVAISANAPGTGALKRLLCGIYAAGYTPAVSSPMDLMTAILERWGWVRTNSGTTYFDKEEIWRPVPGWRPPA